MAIASISLSNTFAQWLTTTQNIVTEINKIESGSYTKTANTLFITSTGTGLYVTNTAIMGTGSVLSDFSVGRTLTVSGNSSLISKVSVSQNNITFSTSAPRSSVIIAVNRGEATNPANANAQIMWNESAKNWQLRDVDNSSLYYKIITDNDAANTNIAGIVQLYDNTDSNSTILAATANSVKKSVDYTTIVYGQANTATELSISAYGQANTGTSIAVFAYNQANTGTSIAVSAYSQANTAYNQANTGTSIAISAYNKANTVSSDGVNAAYNQANAATSIAVSAYGQANTAYNQANTANSIAISAYGQANLAFTRANTANSIAISAYGQANLAFTRANTANSIAISAYGQANTANTIATSANTRLNSIISINGILKSNGTVVSKATSGTDYVSISGTETLSNKTLLGYTEKSIDLGSGNTVNVANGSYFTKTISTNVTLSFTNQGISGNVSCFILELTNGGSKTITWANTPYWASGIAPTLTSSGVDILGFYYTDAWKGFLLAKNIQ